MKPPHIPEDPPPVVSDGDLARLIKSREGKDFLSRRDAAIIRLLLEPTIGDTVVEKGAQRAVVQDDFGCSGG